MVLLQYVKDARLQHLLFVNDERFKQLNSKVNKVFSQGKDGSDLQQEDIKCCLREIFSSRYPKNADLFFSIDENFLWEVRKLMDAGNLADALMSSVSSADGSLVYPIIYPALCGISHSWHNEFPFGSMFACKLLKHLGKKGRKYFFERCTYVSQGEKRSILDGIINNFSPSYGREMNCIFFINELLMNVDSDECAELLTTVDNRGKTIVDHVREVRCNKKIKAEYRDLIKRHELGEKFFLCD
jgi:hypothetical protein